MSDVANRDLAQAQQFTVEGMSCGHCVSAVTEEVSAVDGVSSVDVDLDAKLVTVVGGASDAIIAAIDDAGYDANPSHPRRTL